MDIGIREADVRYDNDQEKRDIIIRRFNEVTVGGGKTVSSDKISSDKCNSTKEHINHSVCLDEELVISFRDARPRRFAIIGIQGHLNLQGMLTSIPGSAGPSDHTRYASSWPCLRQDRAKLVAPNLLCPFIIVMIAFFLDTFCGYPPVSCSKNQLHGIQTREIDTIWCGKRYSRRRGVAFDGRRRCCIVSFRGNKTMTLEEQIKKTVLGLIGQIAPEADVGGLESQARLRDQLDFDSVDFVNFALALQETFGVSIPEGDFFELGTLDGCINYLISKNVSWPFK
jgi:acyl carrier protein